MRHTSFPPIAAVVLAAFLVACDSSSPAEPEQPEQPDPVGVVGDDGGQVGTSDGEVTLEFPAGAVAGDTEITVEPAEAVPEDPALIPGTAYDFGPDGATFDEPVTLTVRYDPADLPEGVRESSLVLHKAVGNGWQRIEGSVADVESRTVTGTLSSFSVYGVLSLGEPAGVDVHEGDAQSGAAFHAVAVAPAVRVLNDDGEPLPGVAVTFEVAAGDGTLTGAVDTTDAAGVAAVGSWTLGDVGEQSLTATVEGLDPVAFTATAVAPCDFTAAYTLGATAESELSSVDCVDDQGRYVEYWELVVEAPVSVTMTMASEAVSPFIGAHDEAGDFVITQYAASPGFTRALLGPGTYRLAARSAEAGVGGAYTLTVEEASHDVNECDVAARVFATPGTVDAGQLAETDCHDEFGDPENVVDWYIVYLSEGQTLSATLTLDGAGLLSLWGADGEHKDIAQTSGAGTVELRYTATQNGFHLVHPIGRPGVSYEIALEATTEPFDPCASTAPYAVGTTVTGMLTGQSCIDANGRFVEFYELEIDEQLSATLSMGAGDFTPFIGASDGAGDFVVTQYVASPGFTRAILAPGRYVVAARAVEEGAGGYFDMTVAEASHDVNECSVGARIFATPGITDAGRLTETDCYDEFGDPENVVDWYIVHMNAGETLTATLTLGGAGLLSIWGADGQHKTAVDTPEAGTVEFTYTAEGTGWHTFHPIGRPGASYQLTLSEVEGGGAAASAFGAAAGTAGTSRAATGRAPSPLAEITRR